MYFFAFWLVIFVFQRVIHVIFLLSWLSQSGISLVLECLETLLENGVVLFLFLVAVVGVVFSGCWLFFCVFRGGLVLVEVDSAAWMILDDLDILPLNFFIICQLFDFVWV